MRARVCAAPGCEAVAMDGPRCPACEAKRAARSAAFDKARAADPHRKVYGKALWRKGRAAFLAAHPACAACAARGVMTPATEVDHIQPVRARPDLAFDPTNWRALCAPCHASKTAREDGGFGAPKGGRVKNPGRAPRTVAPPNSLARAVSDQKPMGTT